MRFQSENAVFKFLRSYVSKASKLLGPRQRFVFHENAALYKRLTYQIQGGEGRGTMETYNGLLPDKLPATFKWIYLSVQKKSKNPTTSFRG